jgi:hypothetical protein
MRRLSQVHRVGWPGRNAPAVATARGRSLTRPCFFREEEPGAVEGLRASAVRGTRVVRPTGRRGMRWNPIDVTRHEGALMFVLRTRRRA